MAAFSFMGFSSFNFVFPHQNQITELPFPHLSLGRAHSLHYIPNHSWTSSRGVRVAVSEQSLRDHPKRTARNGNRKPVLKSGILALHFLLMQLEALLKWVGMFQVCWSLQTSLVYCSAKMRLMILFLPSTLRSACPVMILVLVLTTVRGIRLWVPLAWAMETPPQDVLCRWALGNSLLVHLQISWIAAHGFEAVMPCSCINFMAFSSS